MGFSATFTLQLDNTKIAGTPVVDTFGQGGLHLV